MTTPMQPLPADPVEDVAATPFSPRGRAITIGEAVDWIGGGFDLFKRAPWLWIAIIVIYFIVSSVLNLIPIAGPIASSLIMPVLIGGMMLGCASLDAGGELEIEHLFAGFKHHTGKLVALGALMLVAATAIMLVAVVLAIAVAGTAALAGAVTQHAGLAAALAGLGSGVFLFIGVVFVLFLMLGMAFYYAPALIALRGLSASQAMKASFLGCLKNIVPLFVLGVIFIVLAIIAMLPLLLGLLVLWPVMIGAMYHGYRSIFCTE